ncbi:MAG: diguanylate cyclase, partial [Gemmatimonadales bacterium]
ELFRRREIVGASEPPRAPAPVLAEGVTIGVGAAFRIERNGHGAPSSDEQIDDVLGQIGLAPNGRPWDCGACGYRTCRQFAAAAVLGRTTLKSCPPYLDRVGTLAQQQAAEDALTGLASFRVLRDRLANEVARCNRSGDHFAVLFLDLDNFKQVNDRFGHEAGNEVLRRTARACGRHIRSTDLAGRYGGDEFVVVLVGTGVEGARMVGEKVRAAVQEAGEQLDYPAGLVTASIGVAEYRPNQEDDDVLVAADRALYRAKAAGRNQVATGE